MNRFLGALLLGVLVGGSLVFAVVSSGSGDSAPSRVKRDIVVTPRVSVTEAEQLRATRYASIDSVEDVMSLPTTFSRSEAMYALAGRIDAGRVQALIFDALRIADDIERDQALDILFHRLVDLDPRTALALSQLDEFSELNRIESGVWYRWSRSDLEAALEAARGIGDRERRGVAAQALFSAHGFFNTPAVEQIARELGLQPDSRNQQQYLSRLLENSPSEAAAYLNSLPMGLESQQVLSILASHYARHPSADAEQLVGMIDDVNRRQMFRRIMTVMQARVDPAASLRDLLASPNPGNNGQVFTAVQSLASQDLAAALRFFDEATSPANRSMIGMGLARVYAREDPEAAIAWALDNAGGGPSRYGQDLFGVVLAQIAQSDPDLAISQLQSVPVSQRRDQMQQQILMQIASKDPARAVHLVDEMVFTRASGYSSKQMLLGMWAGQDPDGASKWILENRASLNSRELSQLGQSLANTSVETAMRLLPRIEGPAVTSWRRGIAQQLQYSGSFDKAQEFIQQFQGEKDYPGLQSQLIQNLAQSDPVRAEQLARQMPAGPNRDTLLSSMVMTLSMRSPQRAQQLLDMIEGEQARASATTGIVQYMANQDSAAAKSWALSRPDSRQRDTAIVALLGSSVIEPEDVDRFLAALSSAKQRHSAETNYIMTLSYRDPAAARARLARSTLSGAQKTRLEQVISESERRSMNMGGSPYIADY